MVNNQAPPMNLGAQPANNNADHDGAPHQSSTNKRRLFASEEEEAEELERLEFERLRAENRREHELLKQVEAQEREEQEKGRVQREIQN